MAVDMFLKLDGIKGESKDKTHSGEIHIDSFSWGLSQSGSFGAAGGGGAGKVSASDISIMKLVDKSSPLLMQHICGGKHIKEGFITVRKAGDKPLEYLKIKLNDILVSSIHHSGSGGAELIMESLSLNFAKFEMNYVEQKADGSGETPIPASYDFKANAK